jgi:hypothetical protein
VSGFPPGIAPKQGDGAVQRFREKAEPIWIAEHLEHAAEQREAAFGITLCFG